MDIQNERSSKLEGVARMSMQNRELYEKGWKYVSDRVDKHFEKDMEDLDGNPWRIIVDVQYRDDAFFGAYAYKTSYANNKEVIEESLLPLIGSEITAKYVDREVKREGAPAIIEVDFRHIVELEYKYAFAMFSEKQWEDIEQVFITAFGLEKMRSKFVVEGDYMIPIEKIEGR